MKKRIITLAALMLCTALLTGCQCEHEWVEADCTTAKTCTKCNVTEGEALGHSWQDATCTQPKTCSICGATEGDALGHVPGQWSDAVTDYAAAVIRETCVCDRCGEAVDVKEEPVTTLATEDGSRFLCSANEFKQRIENAYAHINEVLGRQFRVEQTTANEEYYAVVVYDGEEAAAVYAFTTDGPAYVQLADADSAIVVSMRMEVLDELSKDTMTHFMAGAMACDPARDYSQAQKDSLDIYQCAYNYPFGYHEQNGLRYAATFHSFAVAPIGDGE